MSDKVIGFAYSNLAVFNVIAAVVNVIGFCQSRRPLSILCFAVSLGFAGICFRRSRMKGV